MEIDWQSPLVCANPFFMALMWQTAFVIDYWKVKTYN